MNPPFHVLHNFVAVCSFEYRSIAINVDLPDDEILSCFVFELTNAASSRQVEQLVQGVEEGTISREAYARTVEKIEHAGAMRHHSIMSGAVTKMGWDPIIDRFKGYTKDFDRYWEENKNGAHVESSRKRWDLIVQESIKN
jgi:hypothetical protein